MRPNFNWNIGLRSLPLGQRTLIMGIVNVTPDSFSDGGHYLDRGAAVEHALGMLEEGADIVDIGGESTRPGARVSPNMDSGRSGSTGSVNAEEELGRVIPVIEQVKRAIPGAVVSIDTYKATVARAAVEAGAEIVNDVSALRWDPQMRGTIASLRCGVVLMHMRGRPEEWGSLPPVSDLLGSVSRELKEWVSLAIQAGIEHNRIVLDPGFGFGKRFDENYPLLAHFGKLQELGFPLLSGTSRKSFIGRTVARGAEHASPNQRLYGTLATVTASILKGAHIVRVHDVTPALEAAAVADAVLGAEQLTVE